MHGSKNVKSTEIILFLECEVKLADAVNTVI
jgi:hypothetical protein